MAVLKIHWGTVGFWIYCNLLAFFPQCRCFSVFCFCEILVLRISRPKTGAKVRPSHSCVPRSCVRTAVSPRSWPEAPPRLGRSRLCVLSACQWVGGWRRDLKECSPCFQSPGQVPLYLEACSLHCRRRRPLWRLGPAHLWCYQWFPGRRASFSDCTASTCASVRTWAGNTEQRHSPRGFTSPGCSPTNHGWTEQRVVGNHSVLMEDEVTEFFQAEIPVSHFDLLSNHWFMSIAPTSGSSTPFDILAHSTLDIQKHFPFLF